MNASTAFASAAVVFALAAFPAHATVSSSKGLSAVSTATPVVAKADFVQGHETIAGVSARNATSRTVASALMTQRYFDVDVIVTLGALALASGAFVAVGLASGRRRLAAERVASPREGWREEVMQALEEDLAQFAVGLRRAA
jgi:hypothetical protein